MNQPATHIPAGNDGALPATLVESARVNLPVAYETAKQAIALCESTDECRTWADKHAALAAYARMRDDRDLHNYALRIQLRSERRWGELDRQMHPDRHRENLQNSRYATDRESRVSERRPAPLDGSSEYQRRVARQLAAVPGSVFESQVESPTPPTKTHLSSLGTSSRASPPPPAWDARAFQTLAQFAKFCGSNSAEELARTVNPEDIDTLRDHIGTAEVWLRLFADSLPVDG